MLCERCHREIRNAKSYYVEARIRRTWGLYKWERSVPLTLKQAREHLYHFKISGVKARCLDLTGAEIKEEALRWRDE